MLLAALRVACPQAQAEEEGGGTVTQVGADQVDVWTRHIWHVSQHDAMTIALAGRLQDITGGMREAAGLEPFDAGAAFPDAEFGECSVHASGCRGQETHP